jgi:glycosyltransferase involved in cell wall biosynthesis
LRILFCNYEYPPLGGGGGIVMAALARELADRHEVTVLTSRAGDLPPENTEGGVRVIRVPVFFRNELAVANIPSMFAYLPMGAIKGLALRRERFDVVNTHFVVPTGPLGHVLAALYGVPNVLSLHGGDLFDPSKKLSPHRHAWLRGPIRAMLRRAEAVIGQSRDTVRHVHELYGVQRPIELIPLGIHRPPALQPSTREHFGLPRDAFVLVAIGRLVARKSTAQLVHALARSGLANAHLVIVGDGPDREPVRRAAAELGLAERVHLLGFVPDDEKFAALSVADAFVSTSQHEGFGLVFLEAMAFGLPIICYDRGGQTDFLASDVTGHVVRLNDLDGFVQALIELHGNPCSAARMKVNNRAQVENYFIDRCAARYEAVFEQAVRLGRGARLSAVTNRLTSE